MKHHHLEQSVLTIGVVAGAAIFGGGWQEAHADTINETSTAAISSNVNNNNENSINQAQSTVASAQTAVSQAQQNVDSASAAVVSAAAVQSEAVSQASAAQSECSAADAVAQSQMPSQSDQAAALNGSEIYVKSATPEMFNDRSGSESSNVKNKIGEDHVTENWTKNTNTGGYDMDPSLNDALKVVPTLNDDNVKVDPTNLTNDQQKELAEYVSALINQVRSQLGLSTLTYNDITLKQALAIVKHAYNDPQWNVNQKQAHNDAMVFDKVTYQNNGISDTVNADWECIGLIDPINNHNNTTIKDMVHNMSDLKRVVTVSLWDMLFNDAHAKNSHAQSLLNPNTRYIGVAVDNYGALHIYGLVSSSMAKVNATQEALANANKNLEAQKDNLSQIQTILTNAKTTLSQALQHLNILTTVEMTAADHSNNAVATSAIKNTRSKTASQNSLNDVTVQATDQPTKINRAKQGNNQLLSTSNAISTMEETSSNGLIHHLLPQTGNERQQGLTIAGVLMGMAGFTLGLLGLRKRNY